jgi:hypothetical protein
LVVGIARASPPSRASTPPALVQGSGTPPATEKVHQRAELASQRGLLQAERREQHLSNVTFAPTWPKVARRVEADRVGYSNWAGSPASGRSVASRIGMCRRDQPCAP